MRISSVLAFVILSACGGGSTSTPTTTPAPASNTATTTAPPPAAENDKSICTSRPDEFGPIMLDAEHAARRRGRDILKYSAANTTKETPLEVCGVRAQEEWLMRATCDDGSRPYENSRQVAQSRSGNVGPGGTCGTIIDLYVATCPEKAYQLFIDMYHCGPGESFM
jgi:hypothetical protein